MDKILFLFLSVKVFSKTKCSIWYFSHYTKRKSFGNFTILCCSYCFFLSPIDWKNIVGIFSFPLSDHIPQDVINIEVKLSLLTSLYWGIVCQASNSSSTKVTTRINSRQQPSLWDGRVCIFMTWILYYLSSSREFWNFVLQYSRTTSTDIFLILVE